MSSVEPRGSSASGPRVKSTAANPCADTESLDSVGNRPDPRSGRRGLRDRTGVLPLTTRAGDFALGIRRFLTAGIGAARGGVQTDGVTVRQDQRVQTQPELTAALDAPGPLRFQQLTAKIGTDRDHNAIALGDRKRRLKVDRVSRLGAVRGDTVLEHDADASSRRNGDSFTGANLLCPSRLGRDRGRGS